MTLDDYERKTLQMFLKLDKQIFKDASAEGFSARELLIQVHTKIALKTIEVMVKDSKNPEEDAPEIASWFLDNIFLDLECINYITLETTNEIDLVNKVTLDKLDDIITGKA